MLRLRSDSHSAPPSDDADDPLTSKPEMLPRPPIPFDSRVQFWRNVTSLSERCLTTALSLSLLILSLRIFSRRGPLSHAEQRGFNAITILLGAFTSLGIGSVLGYLGSMLRWRLLARKKYKMQDIELLLAMQSPSGSAKLLIADFREWRLSLTTFIVMLYLLVNITGRFSIAIFGLTYNLVDEDFRKSPNMATNWTSSVLLARNTTDFDAVEKSHISYLDLVRSGLAENGHLPDIRFDIRTPQNLTTETLHSLRVDPTVPGITGGNVGLTYRIRDFAGKVRATKRSTHAVHSSASCAMFRLDSEKYWKDYGSDNQTSKNWADERNRETIAEVLRVLDRNKAWPRRGAQRATWAVPLVRGSNGSSVTYVVYHETAWECTSSLFETLNGSPHPNPLFDSATLFALPIVEGVERGRAQGPMERSENSCGSPSVNWTASIAYRSFSDLKRQSSPSVGVQTLNFYQNSTGGSAIQKNYYNLYIASLVARLPIAAIAQGNEVLQRKRKNPNAFPFRRVRTTLEVKWGRVGITAGAIVAGQILAITIVLYYCRNVYIPEDSYLTTAELLKTVLDRIEGENSMTTRGLGDALSKVLEGPVSYGTIPGSQGDQPRVAFGCKVDNNFPGFPQLRKPSVFRR